MISHKVQGIHCRKKSSYTLRLWTLQSHDISSNRRVHQGSSVSPSSFPSLASSKEDRHRECDDILSVQDKLGFRENNKRTTLTKVQQQQFNTITIKRSQTCVAGETIIEFGKSE